MSENPNVILLFADQMRGDCMGCDGHPVVQTPNLDHLASHGARFNHAYSSVPSCLPARANLWSGQDQWHTGVLGMGSNQPQTPNNFPHTIAGELTNAGYRTHSVGKGHFHPQWTSMGFETRELDESGRCLKGCGLEDDYRRWFYENAPEGVTPDDHGVNWNAWQSRPWHTEEYLHPTAWTMNRSIEFLKNHDTSRPFFLNISFARPHSPYVPPQPYFDMYNNRELPEPHLGEWSEMHDSPVDAADVNAWRGKMQPYQVHRARSGYYGEISFIDAQIGRLINWLHRHRPEIMRNTWIIFAADHGDMQGDHNLWRKTYAYEGSARIPFIVTPPVSSFPGGKYRMKADEVVELRDVMPTILDICGLEIPNTVEGKSVVQLLSKPDKNWREFIHGEHCKCYGDDQEMQYVTDGKRKFVWLPRINVEQFFDLEVDPGETEDLISAPDRWDEISLWRQRLIDVLEKRDCGWVKNGQLHYPGEILMSPYRDKRWQGQK